MNRIVRTTVLALVVVSAGCYRATINTGLQPNGTMIKQPWAMSFVAGLIPPPEVDAAAKCPDGVAKVETYHSFMNGLVAALTASIITPITIEVSCAAKRTSDAGGSTMHVAEGQSVRDAIAGAMRQAELTGDPVFVAF